MPVPARQEAQRPFLRIVAPAASAKRAVVQPASQPAAASSWLRHAWDQLLRVHRELMAERDETIRLTEELSATRHALAAVQSYAEALEDEVSRLQNARARPAPTEATALPDVDGWC